MSILTSFTPPEYGEKITFRDGQLHVPDWPIIPFIEGDGTGPDIWHAAKRVLDSAVAKAYGGRKEIVWCEVFAGEKAYYRYNQWLPEQTLALIRDHLVAIKGPLTTPVGDGIRSLNVALRQELDLFACLRPVRYFAGAPSPVKRPELVDMVIFRENTEDIYAGIEFQAGSEDAKALIRFLQERTGGHKIRFPESSGFGIKPVSEEGSKRLVRAAITYAIKHGRKSVTMIHKGNIMKHTEGAFKNWGFEVAESDFPEQTFTWGQYDRIKEADGLDAAIRAHEEAQASGKIIIKDVVADIALQQVLTRPTDFDVIATLNLNGDYFSDALSAQIGGIGIAPGGNINYLTGHAMFEATHGTDSKYAGLDMANPGSMILAGVMLLEYLGWQAAADLVYKGMEKAIEQKIVTYDFARLMDGATEVKCSQFADEMINLMDAEETDQWLFEEKK